MNLNLEDSLRYFCFGEAAAMRKAIRLGCFLHCKRKFMDTGTQKEAKKIIAIYNEFYHMHNT